MYKMKNKKSSKKKIFLTLFVLIISFSVVSVAKIKAGTTDNGMGWLWGPGASGTSNDGTNTNVGWVSMNNLNTNGPVSYGVDIPKANGNLSGYAWSENIGWVSFNQSDLTGCPSGTCAAQISYDQNNVGTVTGWARIMSIPQAGSDAGGWQGWIKLHSVAGDPVSYGVQINSDGTITDGQTTSYAWSDELGWIDFSQSFVMPSPVVQLSATPNIIYVDQTPLPQSVTVSWQVTNCDPTKGEKCSCQLVSSDGTTNKSETISGSGTVSGSDNIVFPNSGTDPITYTLTCTNANGSGNNKAIVTAGCDRQLCSAGQCTKNNSNFVLTTTGSTCTSSPQCTTSADCTSTNLDWREVSPN